MNEPRSSLDWICETGANGALRRELRARALKRSRRRKQMGFAVAALTMVAFAWMPFSQRQISDTAPGTSTHVAGPERRTLPDGSIAELRTGATLEIDFSGPQRRVRLREGQAHFRVMSDPSRPFVVSAGNIEVRAVGTAFSVEVARAAVEVVVTEGRIAVDHSSGSLATAAAGERVVVNEPASATPMAGVGVLEASELAARLAWRVPKLEFSATPLREVVELFNRHGATKLKLADRSLERLRMSGLVRADQPEVLVSLLTANYGVHAEQQPDGEIVLQSRQSGPMPKTPRE